MNTTENILDLLRKLHVLGERDNAINEIQSLPRGETLAVLAEIENGANASLACDAAEMMVRLDSKGAVDYILPLLGHSEANVRWWVCGLLHDCGDHRATAALTSILLHDPVAHVRVNAACALGSIRDPASLHALKQAVEKDKGEDWEGRTVSAAAREAIERITTPPKPRWGRD